MNAIRMVKILMAPLVILLLALSATVYSPAASVSAPPPQVQGQSFSISGGDPLSASGIHPADILGIGGGPALACEDLGLACADPTTGALDDISGLSFGWDFTKSDLPPLQFSVDGSAQGAAGTAVQIEANCSPPQPGADAFESALDNSNLQDLDGDGVACGSNTGYGLGLAEGAASDNIDALVQNPCEVVDLDCNGVPEYPIYLVLAPNSPTLDMLGATTADILMTGVEYAPLVWAVGTTDLGLASGDEIDALCIQDNGNGRYDLGDRVLFSLAPGSPTLASLPASPAAILSPSAQRIAIQPSALGLASSDNVDALVCTSDISSVALFLPIVLKNR